MLKKTNHSAIISRMNIFFIYFLFFFEAKTWFFFSILDLNHNYKICILEEHKLKKVAIKKKKRMSFKFLKTSRHTAAGK